MVVVSSVPVVLCFASVFLASSAHGGVDDEILEYNFTRDENGGYFYRFKTSNGIEREETGQVVEANDKDSVILQVVGYYKFLRENGEFEEVKYSAGQNGFVVLPSAKHQLFGQQKLAVAKQKELLPAEKKIAEPDDDDEEVGTRIQTCVIASLCGTAPFGG